MSIKIRVGNLALSSKERRALEQLVRSTVIDLVHHSLTVNFVDIDVTIDTESKIAPIM